jgi:hypothetical protein
VNGRIVAIIVALAATGIALLAGIRLADAQPPAVVAQPPAVRFAAVDVYIDSSEPLAAWQFELEESSGSMKVVGIENGDSSAFAGTPHYDRDAVAQDRAERIVVADYSLAARDELPRGQTRVATVHVRLTGGRMPDFRLQLIAAGDVEGRSIPAEIGFEFQDGSNQ